MSNNSSNSSDSDTTVYPSTIARFSLLEIDDTPEITPVKATPVIPVVTGWDSPTVVNADGKARADADQAMIKEILGLDVTGGKDQLFGNGTELITIGKETVKADAAAYDALGTIGAVNSEIKALISAENRKDYAIMLGSLRLDHEGTIRSKSAESKGIQASSAGLLPDANAWGQLVSKAPDGVTNKANVNSWIGASSYQAKIRTRNPDSAARTRDAFAVMSASKAGYQVFDFNQVSDAIAARVPSFSKASFEYDPTSTRWSLDVKLGNPQMFREGSMTVGELQEISLRLDGADNGSKGLKGSFIATRLRCKNATKIADKALEFKRIHKGSDLADFITRSLNGMADAVTSFGKAWETAHASRIHDKYDGTVLSAEETFKRLIAQGFVTLPGLDADQACRMLMAAWNMEPGDTAAHANMAITRAAQGFDGFEAQSLQEQAGELLYQHVYQLS